MPEKGPQTPERKPRLTNQTRLLSLVNPNGGTGREGKATLARPYSKGGPGRKEPALPLPTLPKPGFSLIKKEIFCLEYKKGPSSRVEN